MMLFLTTTNASGDILVIRRDDDGSEWWLSERENDPDYIKWIAEGNEPQAWQQD